MNDKTWLKSEPAEGPLTGLVGAMEDDTDDPNVVSRIHHFLLPAEGWGAAADAKEVKDLAGEAQKVLKAWRTKVKTKPSKAQLDRLVALGSRVESLWKLTLRRLQVAETEARREIDYFGKRPLAAEPVEAPAETSVEAPAVTREQIEQSLNDENGSYQRLRRVMDAWNALWFWPLTERATGGVQPPSLEEWISALEGVLGIEAAAGKASKKYGLIEGQTSLLSMASWGELEAIESFDHSTSQAKPIAMVKTEHLWLGVCERVARDQGFFHWELDFASIFARGGFDLQAGNPPWVRPRSDEAALLAEGDPWWQLTDKPTQAQIRMKRHETLARLDMEDYFVENAIPTAVLAGFLGSIADYSVLAGLQPDLYRAFMVRTWRSSAPSGAIALIHPGSHFTEKKAAHLRAEAYRRVRRHWHFRNKKKLFAELTDQLEFGVHVYASRRLKPKFIMAASLYQPDTAERSLSHDGSGEAPALKTVNGDWDTLPHAQRILTVDSSVLAVWADILDDPGTPSDQARMVFPINRASSSVLEKMSRSSRVRELGLQFSRGWDESIDRKKGYFEVGVDTPNSWNDVILQGPHFTVANPYSKQPREVVRSNNDWDEIDIEALPTDFIPRTAYQPHGDRARYDCDYGTWLNSDGVAVPVRNHFRIAWRRMAAIASKRTLHVGLMPPGAAHVNPVYSVGPFPDARVMLGQLGLLSSIPADFLIKSSGSSEIQFALFGQLPKFNEHSPLAGAIIDRTARLVCLTSHYAPVWVEAMGTGWSPGEVHKNAKERRQAEVELDAIAAIETGLAVDELCTIYRTQFPVLRGYEQNDLYDAHGRKIPGDIYRQYSRQGEGLSLEDRTWIHPQSGAEYVFEFPFRSFDREEDMRKAYAHFSGMLGDNS